MSDSVPYTIGRVIGGFLGRAINGAAFAVGVIIALKAAIHFHWLG
jgi:hypothetical protein